MRNDKYIVCTLVFQTEYIFSVKSIQNLSRKKNTDDVSAVYFTQFILRLMRCLLLSTVTGKFTDFPVCVIRYIFIRKLSHLTISSPFILINQKMDKKPQ